MSSFRLRALSLPLVLALACAPALSYAQAPPPGNVPLRLASDADGAWRERAVGMLSVALRVRTSIETADGAVRTRIAPDELFATPFLIWSGRDAVVLDAASRVALGEYLAHGGLLFVDGDTVRDAAFLRSMESLLNEVLPTSRLAPMGDDEVLARTFYLLPPGGVRSPGDVRVARVGRDIAVVESRGDLLGALSEPGGALRERATRWLVNVVMYALCLDYKDDQVHAPFLMRRRRSLP